MLINPHSIVRIYINYASKVIQLINLKGRLKSCVNQNQFRSENNEFNFAKVSIYIFTIA